METQNISEFSKKKIRFSVSTWSLNDTMAVQGGGPVVYTTSHKVHSVGSISGPIFFAFFVTCLAEEIGFPCTYKACQKKMNRLQPRIH